MVELVIDNNDKKFLSPIELKIRFKISGSKYRALVNEGLPTIKCAGVVRHPLQDVYFWCEDNNIKLQDSKEVVSKTKLMKILGIDNRIFETWKNKGLPCIPVLDNKRNHITRYNINEVSDWLKSQIVEV